MMNLIKDIKYGLRQLRKSPGFTAVIILTLTLGIGANTSIFSVVNAVMLKPLPYKDSDRIVALWEQTKWGERNPSHQNFLYWCQQNQVFESLSGYRRQRFYVTGINRSREIEAYAVSSNIFSLLGVESLLGNVFLPENEQPGNDRVIVLSHSFWRDHIGGTPDVIGKTINLTSASLNPDASTSLDQKSYTIVGVMPPGFQFPFERPVPFWVPLVFVQNSIWPSGRPVASLARLKKGVKLEQAREAMAVVASRLQQMDPKANAERSVGIEQLLNKMLTGKRKLLLLLLGASGFVLLIACSNVANLFLARSTVRQHEIVMRKALGASRSRILRQMLTESLLLSVGGGLLGLLLTLITLKGLMGLCPADVPRMKETGIDLSVLIFTSGVCVFTGLLFGVMPAWKAADIRVSHILKEGFARSSNGGGWRRLHSTLVISQIGLSLILLIGAVLLIRSLIVLQRVDLGFRPENVLAVEVRLPQAVYPESQHCTVFFDELLQRIRSLPHIQSVALVAGDLQLGAMEMDLSFTVPDRPPYSAEEPYSAKWIHVSPDFFETMGIKLLKGRFLTDRDGSDNVLIDANLARKHFGDSDPVGRKIVHDGHVEMTIIGVVNTTRDFMTPDPTEGALYMRLNQSHQNMIFIIRTDGDPKRLASTLRAQITALSKEDVISKIETLEMTLAEMLSPRRFTMVLLSLFAGLALILATIGVYGLLQYSTTQQTHDIGIRLALGARRINVLIVVMGYGLKLTLLGVAVGLVGALALTKILSSLLYDVSPTDPLTFTFVSLVLIGVALLACYIPARKAASVDPMEALRYE